MNFHSSEFFTIYRELFQAIKRFHLKVIDKLLLFSRILNELRQSQTNVEKLLENNQHRRRVLRKLNIESDSMNREKIRIFVQNDSKTKTKSHEHQ
jgi:hypothetical protein